MAALSPAEMDAQWLEYEAHEERLNRHRAERLGLSYEEYERLESEHLAEEEREEAARIAAGGRTVCEKCGRRTVKHQTVCTLGYPGHPGAEFSDYGKCENPQCGHVEF